MYEFNKSKPRPIPKSFGKITVFIMCYIFAFFLLRLLLSTEIAIFVIIVSFVLRMRRYPRLGNFTLSVDSEFLIIRANDSDVVYKASRKDFRKLIIDTYYESGPRYYLITRLNTLELPFSQLPRSYKVVKDFIKDIESDCTIVTGKTDFWGRKKDKDYKKYTEELRGTFSCLEKVGHERIYTSAFSIE